MNKCIYKQSLSSFNILIKLFGEDRVKVNDKNEIMLDGMILLDDEDYKLVLYTLDSKKMRRKNKSEYKYLNFYNDCSKLVDYFLSEFTEIETVCMISEGKQAHLFFKNTYNNKNVDDMYFDIEEGINLEDFYITKYIKIYLDRHSNY